MLVCIHLTFLCAVFFHGNLLPHQITSMALPIHYWFSKRLIGFWQNKLRARLSNAKGSLCAGIWFRVHWSQFVPSVKNYALESRWVMDMILCDGDKVRKSSFSLNAKFVKSVRDHMNRHICHDSTQLKRVQQEVRQVLHQKGFCGWENLSRGK